MFQWQFRLSLLIPHFSLGQHIFDFANVPEVRAVTSKGKTTGLALTAGKLPQKVNRVRVIGREEATNAERARDEFVLRVLQGAAPLHASPFVQMLWFPAGAKPEQEQEQGQGNGQEEDVSAAGQQTTEGHASSHELAQHQDAAAGGGNGGELVTASA